MEVRFGQRRVKNNEILPLAVANDLQVTWPGEGMYSLAFYDLSNPNKSPYAHFWATNIPGDDLYRSDIRIPYTPPAPPEGAHTYVVDLFRQTRQLPKGTTGLPRENFPIVAIANSSGLELADRLMFQVTPGPRTRSAANGTQKNLADGANGSQKNLADGADGANKSTWTTGLNDADAAYCRCTIESAAKQPETCLTEKAWFQQREGKKCYNPYAVCHKSVEGEAGRVDCGSHFVFENIPDLELIGFANLNGITMPANYDRAAILQAVAQWKAAKFGK